MTRYILGLERRGFWGRVWHSRVWNSGTRTRVLRQGLRAFKSGDSCILGQELRTS